MKRFTYIQSLFETFAIDETSAKAKLAYLKRKLQRRYFKKKPTAAVFQDAPIKKSDDSLT